MRKTLPLIFLCLFSIISGKAQQYNFTNYSVTEGLAQSQVYTIIEDQKGYLWLGTRGGGLCRFDGKNFTTYTTQNGLASNYINALIETAEGIILTSTDNGINQFHKGEFSKLDNLPNGLIVNQFLQDDFEKIWMATDKGLYFIDNEKVVRKFEAEGFSTNQSIYTLCQDEHGQTWIGGQQGLYKIKGKDFEVLKQANGTTFKEIRGITISKEGILWIAAYNQGIFLSDGSTILRQLNKSDGLISTKIQVVKTDQTGNIWLGTADRGVMFWQPKSSNFTRLSTQQGLANNNVQSIVEDSWGNIWLGTSGGGLSRYSGQQFEHFTRNEGLKGNYIHALEMDEKGRIWVASSNNGIQYFQDGDFIDFGQNSNLSRTICKAIFTDQSGHLWFGTSDNGLTVFLDSLFLNFTSDNGLAGNFITTITQDTLGNIWTASQSSGITKIEWNDTLPSQSVFNRFTSENGLPTNQINDLHIDRFNRVWIATNGAGIIVLEDDEILKHWTINTGLKDNYIRTFSEDNLGFLWYGTASSGIGNFRLYDNSFIIKNDYPQVSSKNIQLLQADASSKLWIGTQAGLDLLTLDAARNVIDKDHFAKIEGFRGIETTRNAALSAGNNLWFGTVNGLSKYNKSVQTGKEYAPKIHLKNAKLFNQNLQDIPYIKELKNWTNLPLAHDENELTFVVEALHLSYPEDILYQWRIRGKADVWSEWDNNSTYQRAFLPGNYTLQVRAKTKKGNQYSQTLSFPFTIATPFWQTWWFRIAAILASLLLIGLFIKWRIAVIQKRAKRIQNRLELDKKLLELEQKALQLQMNPHFIFNALNSIQGSINPEDIKTARLQLAKFSKLMRATLENARTETITLEEEISTLTNYLSLEQFSHGDTFDYEIMVADSIDPEAIFLPSMILQPFVENAIIHGVAHLDKRGKILVEFTRKGKRLSCVLEDNGIGRERAKSLKSQIKEGHQSAALDITRERLDLLRSGKAAKNSLQIFDLKDDGGNALGTRVEIIIPIEEY